MQKLPPLLRVSPSSEERQQDGISEERTMTLQCLKSVQHFHCPSEAWGGGGAKQICLLCENREIQKKRFLFTHSPRLSTTLLHLGKVSPRKRIKDSYDI